MILTAMDCESKCIEGQGGRFDRHSWLFFISYGNLALRKAKIQNGKQSHSISEVCELN